MKFVKKICIVLIILFLLNLFCISSSYLTKITNNKAFLIKNDKSEYSLITGKGKLEFLNKAGKSVIKYNIPGNLNHIIDLCVADLDNNGKEKVLLLLGRQNQVYAEAFIIIGLNESLKTAFKIYEKNVKTLNPWKVQTADVDGDFKKEISLGVYKTAQFHPVMAKRPFIYNWANQELTPKWLGSRLARPFDNYIFTDIDNDKLDELVSIEYLEDGKKVIAAYKWKGFGFESIGQSIAFSEITDLQAGKFEEGIGYSIYAVLKKNNGKLNKMVFKYGNNSINLE